jgi:hypothetical protein
LTGVTKPTLPERAPTFPNAEAVAVDPVRIAPGDSFAIDVALKLPEGVKLNPDAPMPYLLEAPDHPGALAASVSPTGGRIAPPEPAFRVEVPLAERAEAGDALTIQLSASAFLCEATLCEIHSYVWTIPVQFADGGGDRVTLSVAAGR